MKKQEKILFIAALHGDEGFSVEVLQKVEKLLPPELYAYDWIIGNPEAYSKQVRFTQADLNRVAPGNITSGVYEEKRAAELITLGNTYDTVIDLHGTHADCGAFIITANPTSENLMVAFSMPIQNIVIWPSSAAEKGPVTKFLSCPAVGIEFGPKDSAETAQQLEQLITSVLLEKSSPSKHTRTKKNIFEVYDSVKSIDTTNLTEFKETTLGDETFYPLLIDMYEKGSVRKMRKLHD